jgi:hypothetical protein
MDIETTFEANSQLAEPGKPGMRALDNPTMSAEAVVLLDTTTCDAQGDASLAQTATGPCKVIALAGMKLVRAALRSAGQARHRWYCIDQVFEDNRVMPIGPSHHHRQRKAALVYDEMMFAAELTSIRGVRASLLAPRGWPPLRHRCSHDFNRSGHVHAGG